MGKNAFSLKDKINKNVLFGTSYDLPKVIELEVESLEANPDQPRKYFDEQALQELANSIKEKGLIQPIVVKQKNGSQGFIVVAGERRWRAHKLLGLETIPAIKTEGNPDEIALIENIQRENLDPLEEASALAKMVERHKWTHENLSKAVGKARNTISEILKLNDLPQKIKDEYRDTGVSKSVLVQISRINDLDEQSRFWEQIKKGGITVKKARAEKNDKTKDLPSPEKLAVQAGKSFIKKLSQIQQFEKSDYEKLLQIQEELGEIISRWPFAD